MPSPFQFSKSRFLQHEAQTQRIFGLAQRAVYR